MATSNLAIVQRCAQAADQGIASGRGRHSKVACHAAQMGLHCWPPESGRRLRAMLQTHMPAARSRYMTARSVAATGCTVMEPMMPAST